MADKQRFLNDQQWVKISPLLPKPKHDRKGGRLPSSNHEVIEGILWNLRSGARWYDLPSRYPSASTWWRRLKLWEENGVWLDIWRAFLTQLDAKGALDLPEALIDGNFAPTKKGAPASEQLK